MRVDVDRFDPENKNGHGLSFGIYRRRHAMIAPWLANRLPEPICPDISCVQVGQRCSVVGTIMKENSCTRPGLKQDSVLLTDAKGQLRLSGVRFERVVSGIVIGVNGVLKTPTEFAVSRLFEPVFPDLEPVYTQEPLKVAFISNLVLNSDDFDMVTGDKLIEAINSDHAIKHVVLLGSTFPAIEDATPADWAFKLRITEPGPLDIFESFLNRLNCHKLLIPGEYDPVPATLPQPAILPQFIADVDNADAATNPVSFSIENLQFICSSGDSVLDVVRDTGMSFHEAQIMLLTWRHLAPSHSQNFEHLVFPDTDPLVLDSIPNVFVCGHADKAAWNDINGVTVISVPDFWATRSIVVFDGNTGECTSMDFD